MDMKNKANLYNSEIIDSILDSIDNVNACKVETKIIIAAQIDIGMIASGLDKNKFAKLMKQDVSVITTWLSGTHNFSIDTIIDIEQVLDIQIININEK